MTETTKAIEQIQRTADESTDEERFTRTMSVGQIAHQGDIYVQCVEDDHPRREKIHDRQLAPGNTKGSRHVVRDGEGVDLYANETGHALHGPIIIAPKRWHIDHPEHATWSLPSGTYRVGYQRDFEREEIERVRD